jgi:hypothetical protein
VETLNYSSSDAIDWAAAGMVVKWVEPIEDGKP